MNVEQDGFVEPPTTCSTSPVHDNVLKRVTVMVMVLVRVSERMVVRERVKQPVEMFWKAHSLLNHSILVTSMPSNKFFVHWGRRSI